MRKSLLILGPALVLILPKPVSAHAFGQTYNLPVPLWLFLFAGAMAVAVSFVLIGRFFRQGNPEVSYPAHRLSKPRLLTSLTGKQFRGFLGLLSVFLFWLTIFAGLFGSRNPNANLAPTFVWIIFVLGLTYTSAIVGNVWEVINPWKVMLGWLERFSGMGSEPLFAYPRRLGYLPAFVSYFLFIWNELLSSRASIIPDYLSILILVYTGVTLIGAISFGGEVWFQYAEFFSVFFRLMAKISPFEYRQGEVYLRPPFVGLLREGAERFSLVLFILFMLSSTAFDGFRATTAWNSVARSLVPFQSVLGSYYYEIMQTVLLLLSPLLFLAVYLGCLALARILVRSRLPIRELALKFAFSLVPIALVYNVAHYYTLLLVQGQSIIALASDPFGLGWNLFNTAQYRINVGILNAAIVWYSEVAFIVLGHIAAVYVAHVLSLKSFPSHKAAVASQLPILLLMITYTMTGLWILSQPITVGG